MFLKNQTKKRMVCHGIEKSGQGRGSAGKRDGGGKATSHQVKNRRIDVELKITPVTMGYQRGVKSGAAKAKS